MRVGATIAGTDVALYAKNLFDRRASLAVSTYAAGYPGLAERITVFRPRTIGVDVSRRF